MANNDENFNILEKYSAVFVFFRKKWRTRITDLNDYSDFTELKK